MNFSLKSVSLAACGIAGMVLGFLAPTMIQTANGVAAANGMDIQKRFAPTPEAPWNQNTSSWCVAPQHTTLGTCNSVELSGFRIEKINGVYTKDRSKLVQGRSIFINTNGLFFAYFCDELREWRISVPEYVEAVQQGACRGWAAGVGLYFADASVSNGITDWYQTTHGQWGEALSSTQPILE
eukprot:gnl/MRDRNA2_/MRDRNA2_29722_c0_seq1.p1 gnl/MRDRNA2_/MRDRNA2_29722_c0~~gnl/MRDRNA2_/MRDRNA2_29722_c0_seq1.p1  ORF type:complete len:182 (+),score=33.37 gnl/MRDRNA2_/MRDRNA2_29722_c0_seq1:87-632(+)